MDREILIVDNYDSFTYNLAQAFERLGMRVAVRRCDAIALPAVIASPPGALVISPGPGVPEGAGVSVDAVRALSGRIPILGVCLGHQAIGVAFGARVTLASKIVHGKAAQIVHSGRGIFEGITSPMLAARYHSLAIDEATLPAELVVTARSDDGLLMAVEHRSHPTVGVQFHPESVLTKRGPLLLANFCSLASGAVVSR